MQDLMTYSTLDSWKKTGICSMSPCSGCYDDSSHYQRIKAEGSFLSAVFYGYTDEDASTKVKVSVSLGRLRQNDGLSEPVFEAIEVSPAIPLPKPPSRSSGIDRFSRIEFHNSEKLIPGEDYVLAITPHGNNWDHAWIGRASADAYPHGGEGLKGDPRDLAMDLSFSSESPSEDTQLFEIVPIRSAPTTLNTNEKITIDFKNNITESGAYTFHFEKGKNRDKGDYILDRKKEDELNLSYTAPENKLFYFEIISTKGDVNVDDFDYPWDEKLSASEREEKISYGGSFSYYDWDKGYGEVFTGTQGGNEWTGGRPAPFHASLEDDLDESFIPEERFIINFFDSISKRKKPLLHHLSIQYRVRQQ